MATVPIQSNGGSPQAAGDSTKKDRKWLYIAGAAIIVIIVALVFLSGSGSSLPMSPPATNSSPVYLSVSQAEALLGSPIINQSYNYTATSLYNYTSPLNITVLEGFVPTLTGNVTNGWFTIAIGSGPNNASAEYIVLQTANASYISALLASAYSSTFPTLPSIVNGQENGLNYTYEAYTNSTGTIQVLIGWKEGYVSSLYLQGVTSPSNQTDMAQVVSGNIT